MIKGLVYLLRDQAIVSTQGGLSLNTNLHRRGHTYMLTWGFGE